MKKYVFGRLATLHKNVAIALDLGTGKVEYDLQLVWWWPVNWFWVVVLFPFAMIGIVQQNRARKRKEEEARQAGERG